MKKIFHLLVIPLAALIITSCDSTNNDVVSPPETGSIYLSSNPAGAQIWLDGINKSITTPDTIKNVDKGIRTVTLKLQDYADTSFSISVNTGETSIVSNVELSSNIIKTLFGPVRIYETVGTTSSQPSGLDLSSGIAYGVSSSQNDSVDIYYSSSGYLVQSADLYPNLIRVTAFFAGSSANLFDELDSDLRNTGTWTNNIGDRESNYVFLYDHDGHYSKLKIVNWGGGVPGEPAWVDVQWYYNKTLLDNRF